jgi:hypothetical protein
MLAKASPWMRATALRKTVMYSLGFADGRTGYVVVPQELVEHGDENVPSIARERQRRGEVPGGDIISLNGFGSWLRLGRKAKARCRVPWRF